MSRRLAIQMDPLDAINLQSDSTLQLGFEAGKRGYEIFHYAPDTLTWREGILSAHARPVTFHSQTNPPYRLGEAVNINLSEMDVVLLRQDPPFDMVYLSTTYLLEQLPAKTLVVNNPASVRNHPEKLFPLLMRQFMPPTLISADAREIEAFYADYKDIVIKPLYGYGGRAVLRLKPEDGNLPALLEMLLSGRREPVMAQRFLPEVTTGDRRVILVDGEFAGVVGRIPAEGEIRANFRVGGLGVKVELSKKQHEICEALKPELKKHGLIFAGVDLIGDWLTEVNITSPTGIVSINALYETSIESIIWDAIEAKL